MGDGFIVGRASPFEADFEPETLFGIRYDIERYDDALFAAYGIELPSALAPAVRIRKADFLAGRFCAKYLLERRRSSVVNLPIGNGRAPIWPSDIVGSITHNRHWAFAAAYSRDRVALIGIDVETVVDDSGFLLGTVIQPEEAARIERLPLEPRELATLIFSAKESFFKAVYPRVGRIFDFDALEFVDCNVATRQLHFRIVQTLVAGFEQDRIVLCAYRTLGEQQVFTWYRQDSRTL